MRKIGIVYHVIDKTTGEVVKVGSTIQGLKRRFQGLDYQRRYTNHFLKAVRMIESSELDWFEKSNPLCPFLWHLVAIEHIEMLKMGTYRKGPLSNRISPLDQKSCGLDGHIGGAIGGSLSGGSEEGRRRMSVIGKSISHEERVRRARVAGLMNVASGHIFNIQKENLGKGGLVGGLVNAESGHCARIAKLGGLAGGKKGAAIANHIRWHKKRGILKVGCVHCQGDL